ncbi:unnamed protein product [Linum tenue]|uniref:non-specific serine/threonine protein kinase n=1 Tax=Linum tenue TaxID=586396 RepID=A0AAV0QS28_9ROSI|nr:unnamed protein product [Linum tenue]
MRSLIVINLNTNVLTGSIPASIANIPNISYIGFAGNRLSGIVPVEFSNLTFLQGFDVPANKLTGSLPPDICIGGVLKVFTAYNNSLTGPIPRSLKNCSTLTRLRLEKNQLTGNISQDLGVYPDLNYADLSDNKLQGELRSWNWGSLYNLSTLKLARNNISGEIPAEVGKAPHLNLLDLSSNRLTGLIPGELSQLRLYSLSLNGNLLYGHLPPRLGNLSYLEYLNLAAKHQIGSGSSGSVYKAALQSTTKQNQVVAVKKLHDQSGEGVERLKANWRAFRSEIRALTNIKHRNIVKLYGFFSNAQHSLLVYEFMERGSLRSVLDDAEKAKELDWEDRVKIVKAKLSDFGTARLLRPDDRVSTTSFAAGTYGYMAPERAYSKKVDEKWDVYGFGVVALEVIIGKHPGDLISSLTTTTKTTSPSSFSSPPHPTLLKDIIDDRITQPGEDGEVAKGVFAIAKFALACVRAEPSSRPTMQEVTMDMVTFAIPPLTQPFSQVSLEELFALVD